MDIGPQSAPVVRIPGEDLQLPESDLLQEIGRYLMLYQHEQKKRMILTQAYMQVIEERDALHQQLNSYSKVK